jgi:hypothetical protein
MAMVTFAALVVVPHDASASPSVVEPVLVAMTAAWHGLRDLPQDHFNDGTVVEIESLTVKQRRPHVG